MWSLKKETNHLNFKLSNRSNWNEDRLAAIYIEDKLTVLSLDLQNLFQQGVRLGERTCLFAGESSSALSGEADHN